MPTPIEGVDGNWRCHSCNNINLGVRERCNRCALPKGIDVHSLAKGFEAHAAMTVSALALPKKGPVEGVDGNWRCSGCSNINFGIRDKCNRCTAPRSSLALQPYADVQAHMFQMGLESLRNGTNGRNGFQASALQGAHGSTIAPAANNSNNVAQLEVQVALLTQRQTNLELQVQALQSQVAQQAALLTSAGLTVARLRQ
ncbi:hypothetical protein AB1Y20_001994 [Prymnesium parvum]|uniref:RanBP2-type domain-containing protein n=1 Tax=Prymnesium parvum TaxID=97485 RepID=A0AB34J946_PRYPA